MRVRYWKHLRLKDADCLPLSVIQVERPDAADTKRDPRLSWFVWIGEAEADLIAVTLCYMHRFSQEHGYRFDKQSLFWQDVHVRTPAQFERWSWVVAVAHNLLVLARRRVCGKTGIVIPQLGTALILHNLVENRRDR